MNLEFDMEKEFDVLIISCYSKPIKPNRELCLICHDANDEFDKYKLTCKHAFHTRCFRRFCYYKDAVKCPLCNEIKPYKTKYNELKQYYPLL